MEQRDILKINRQLLLLTRQLAQDGDAAELMTGLPRSVIEKISTLDMDEIDELAETVGVSLYTLRLSDPAFSRLLQMPRMRKCLRQSGSCEQRPWRRYFPLRSWKITG
ncbi:MAG: hypothetical protein IPG23_13225 [Burkholderiales bacterium]|nr:hypothetical protein [Burkholderiales bacterium]